MIKVNELRIGNLFIDPLTKSYLRVSELTEEGKIVSTVIDRSKFPLPAGWSTEPIPLTPEILEKCGFENQKYDEWEAFAYKDTPICAHFDGVEWCFKYGFDSDLTFAACEYLHQLQNILFAITGEELSFT
jgi:hypothetical protein